MKKILIYSGAIAVFLFLLYLAWNRENDINKEIKDGPKVDITEASVISDIFIKNLMKFPDDVVFDKSTKNVVAEPDSVYKITGHVKANNTFGQAIPYTYNIRIKYNGGGWSEIRGGKPVNWALLGGNLYNEATKEFTEF